VTPITPGGAHLSHIVPRDVNMEGRRGMVIAMRHRYSARVRPLRPEHLVQPLPKRYSAKHRGYAEGMARHAAAMRDGSLTYRDPVTGFTVFTAKFLADRGYCCDSGCRHCPYEPR
jgi:hypothetical protein